MRLPFLSRRFVIGSLIAFSILFANAFVSYRTIANLIDASRTAENTLKLVGALKDLQGNVAGSEIELRGYIISVNAVVSAGPKAFLGRPPNLSRTYGTWSGAIR